MAMSQSVRVSLGKQGRLVIPAQMRRSLGLQEGDQLIARAESGKIVIEKPEVIEQRLKARLAHIPKERSIVDEFIAERHEAAKQELE